nr:tyrosine protein kinase HCK [Hymenolepis microstoma]
MDSSTKAHDRVHLHLHFLTPFDESFEVPLNRLRVERPLGQGAFGVVYLGSAVNLPGDMKGPIPVAIKMLRVRSNFILETSSEEDLVAFVQEIEMMKFIGKHENVIQLYATSSFNGRPIMIMEYGAEGSLKNVLQKYSQVLADHLKSPDIPQLGKFAQQVAKGMAYLASKGVVHRDLAARNVIISEHLIAKVADFGLTRKAEFYYRMQKSGRVPLKWMAPESICQKLFTTKSDVWSFGVLLWELFSLGEMPASNLPNGEFFKALRSGVSVYTKPKYADDKLYEDLMQLCWKRHPNDRPSFDEIIDILSIFFPNL